METAAVLLKVERRNVGRHARSYGVDVIAAIVDPQQDGERKTLTTKGKWTETGRVFTCEKDGSTYHPEWISRPHSTITLTTDTYTSVVPALSRAAAEAAVVIMPRNGHKRGLRVVKDDGQSAA